MPYEFLDDVAIADVQFRAWGTDLGEVFRAAADATMNVMIHDLASIQPRLERTFTLANEAADMLLFDFLQELIYHKDVEQLLLRVPEVTLEERDGEYRLCARAVGEHLDPQRHEQGVDVKAVTLHRFSLVRDDRGWAATVILDI
jgi:SHS2 domain-containing protein